MATPLPEAPAKPSALDAPDRRELPPGTCMATQGTEGNLCGNLRPCHRHEPEIRLEGESKKDHLLRLYRHHPDYGDRGRASRTATELAEHAQLSPGTARAYVNTHLDETAEAAS